MNLEDYPILEFDPTKLAIIEPSEVYKPIEISKYCVMCFFGDIVNSVVAKFEAKKIFEEQTVQGPIPFYQFEHDGQAIVISPPLVGAPMAAASLELTIALGCRKFIVCGGAGVLDRSIPVGNYIVPDAAIRDEGVSYHYLPPGREVDVDPKAMEAITSTLDHHGQPYQIAKTWTTDAIFRETPSKIAHRKSEGCLTVEMEAAALLAVAKFRNVDLGYLLTGGDDVSGETWDRRSEFSRMPAKERMFWLSVEACLRL